MFLALFTVPFGISIPYFIKLVDEYPQIKECHEKYEALSDLANEASLQGCNDSADGGAIYQKIENEVIKFSFMTYAKVVFDTFNPRKPILRDVWEDYKESTWDEIIGNNFDECDEDRRRILFGMIEEENPYILPQEYYTGRNKAEMYLEPMKMD